MNVSLWLQATSEMVELPTAPFNPGTRVSPAQWDRTSESGFDQSIDAPHPRPLCTKFIPWANALAPPVEGPKRVMPGICTYIPLNKELQLCRLSPTLLQVNRLNSFNFRKNCKLLRGTRRLRLSRFVVSPCTGGAILLGPMQGTRPGFNEILIKGYARSLRKTITRASNYISLLVV